MCFSIILCKYSSLKISQKLFFLRNFMVSKLRDCLVPHTKFDPPKSSSFLSSFLLSSLGETNAQKASLHSRDIKKCFWINVDIHWFVGSF